MSVPKPKFVVDVEITLRTKVEVRADTQSQACQKACKEARSYLDLRPGWKPKSEGGGADGKLYMQPFTIGEPHTLEFVRADSVGCEAAPGPKCAACADKGLDVVHGGN